MTLLLLIPGALSLLVLAAHFLRRGAVPSMALCLALVGLMGVRRPWAARTLQVALVVAAAEWGRTLAVLLPERQRAGEPWERMAAILGSVGLVALLSALAFEHPVLRRRFGRLSDRG